MRQTVWGNVLETCLTEIKFRTFKKGNDVNVINLNQTHALDVLTPVPTFLANSGSRGGAVPLDHIFKVSLDEPYHAPVVC